MKPTLIRALILSLSFSSMVGELLLSQLTNSFVGGTFLTYTLAIGAYLTAMGFSSIYYESITSKLKLDLELVEQLTISIALVSPILIGTSHFIAPSITLWTCLLLTSLLGFLTGLEIPMFATLFANTGTSKHQEALALEFDYYGSFLGAIAFPLLFLPYFDSLQIVMIIVIANIISLGALYAVQKSFNRRIFMGANIAAYICFFIFRHDILKFLERSYGQHL